jgi:TPR repeat
MQTTPFRGSTAKFRASATHLVSPLYIGAVAGLILNDHVLKQAFPGLVTGKLSDFFGLFALAVFLSVMMRHWIVGVHLTIAIAFVLWKSPLSDIVIETWNATMPFRIARVVDYWDLVALSVLPFSMLYLRREWATAAHGAAPTVGVALISVFAFTATSQYPGEPHLSIGKRQFSDGQYDRAIQEYDEALKQWPNLAEVLYLRGIAKLNSGDTAGGEADLAKAASIDPKYAPLVPGR